QLEVAGLARELLRQVEGRADQHDALLAVAERRQEIAQAPHGDRVAEPAVRVEQGEDGGLGGGLDAAGARLARAPRRLAPPQPRRARPGDALAFERGRDPLEQADRAILLEGLEREQPPAGADQRAELVAGAAHSVSAVTRATSS